MDNLDFDKYGMDAYVLLDVSSERIGDAHVFENKQLKQQMQLIYKLLSVAFGSKEVNCEKILEVNGFHYCVITFEKENSLFGWNDNFGENAISFLREINQSSKELVDCIKEDNLKKGDLIIDKYFSTGRQVDVASYSLARMDLNSGLNIYFRDGSVSIHPLEECNLNITIKSDPEPITGVFYRVYCAGNRFDVCLKKGWNVELEFKECHEQFITTNTRNPELFSMEIIFKRSRFMKNLKPSSGELVTISRLAEVSARSIGLFHDEGNSQNI